MKKLLVIFFLLISTATFAQIKVLKVIGQPGIAKADSVNGYVTPTENSLKANKSDTANQVRVPYWKKWVIFGDSFSATPSRYYGRVDTLLNLTGTVTHGVSGNKFSQQSAILDSIISATPNYFTSFDIASILLGVNDFAASLPLGTRSDTAGQPTDAGYLKHMIEKILISNPNIELYVMTPPEANGAGVLYHATNSAGWTLTNLATLISQICADYGVQCIDLHSLAKFNLQTIPTLTSDGLHPNYYGSIVLGNIISQAFVTHNNKGNFDVTNIGLQSVTKINNSTIDSIRIGSVGTPKSTLELNTYTPVITLNNISNTTKYGIQFGNDGFIKQTGNTGELQFNVGRNTTWGGNMSFYTDSVMRMKLTDAAINFYSPISGTTINLSGVATLPIITGPTSLNGALSLNTGINNSSNSLINQTYIGTLQTFIKMSNAGGQFYIGQESSVAGSFFPGSSAYANIFYTAQPIQFLISGKKFEVNSSGTFLSYANNNTGDFVTRDNSTGLLSYRTAAQTLSDIGALSKSDSAIANRVTNLQNTKEPTITAGTTSQYFRGDKTWQNFSTLPVSTATQTALNAKLDTSFRDTWGTIDPFVSDTTNKILGMRQSWVDSIRNAGFATKVLGFDVEGDTTVVNAYKNIVIRNFASLMFQGANNVFQYGWIPFNLDNGGLYSYIEDRNGVGRENIVLTPTGIGVDGLNTPTAKVHFPASSGKAGDAPIKIDGGKLLTTPENGAIERDSASERLFDTHLGIREKITYESDLKAYLTKDSIGNRDYPDDSTAIVDGHLGLYDFYRTGNIVKIITNANSYGFTYTIDNADGVSDSTQFFLSFNSADHVTFYVNWGDGASDNYSGQFNYTPTHKYSTSGTYSVQIITLVTDLPKISNFWINNFPYGAKISKVTGLAGLASVGNIDLSNTKELDSSTYDFQYASTITQFTLNSAGLTSFVPTHNLPAGLTLLDLSANSLSVTAVNNTLVWLDSQTFNAGTKTLHIQNQTGHSTPTGAGMTALTSLQSKGWTITYDN